MLPAMEVPLTMLALLLACGGSNKPDPAAPSPAPADVAPEPTGTETPVVAKPSESRAAPRAEYAGKATDFAMDFHRELADGTSATSGISAQLALSMLAAGAAGDTLAEFGTLFDVDVDDAWHIDQARAMAAFNDTPGIELSVVNALWTAEALVLKEGFEQNLADNYGTTAKKLDFSDGDRAAGIINEWTFDNTGGLIPKLFEPVDVQGASLVLANAVVFKGKWNVPFAPEDTAAKPFQTPEGAADVPMMTGKIDGVSFVDEEGFTGIALPYEKHRASMILVLPDEGGALEDVEARLDPQMLGRLSMSGRRPVNVTMPKWKTEVTHDLEAPLKAMGLASVFGGGDFSAMSETSLTVDAAIQKVFVEVDEEGTEAAAATGVVMKTTSLPPPPVDFVVDRPFFWAIWHAETKTPLFTGRVLDPR